MSTIDDLIPDVEYESDASTTSIGSSITRKPILKEKPHFEKHDILLSLFGILAFIIATLSTNIPFVQNKIIDKGGSFVFVLKLAIYTVIYFAFGLLHFFNVF